MASRPSPTNRRLRRLLAAALLLGGAAALLLALRTAAAETPVAEAPAATPPVAADPTAKLVAMADEVSKEVEALRGWTFKSPVKRQLVTAQEARAWMEKEIERQVPADEVERSQAFLRMVGLLPADCDLKKTFLDIIEGQVGGYYDMTTKTLSMVRPDGGRTMPRLIQRTMVAHELAHALDDQYVDLEKVSKAHLRRSEDMDLVTASLFEGSATSLMTTYMMRMQLSGGADPAELQAYAVEEMARGRVFEESPRYFSSLLATYLCGMQFLGRGNLVALMLTPDNKAVGQNLLAAVKDMPASTEQILHPEKYWSAETRDEPVVVDDEGAGRLLARPGRHVVRADTVGELLCAMLTTPKDAKANLMMLQMASAWTNPAATGWGGDRFYLLASGASPDAAAKDLKDLQGVWFTLWDTPEDRDEFLEAYARCAPAPAPVLMRLGTQGAVAMFGIDEAERQALEKRLGESPPPMKRAGKPWSPWSL
ncbi:MAG: hypothetical protein IMZ66_11640 [Planctomycetes bacterium]|nr:hypothetical protein [Planctomycetota bacterium]